MPRKLKLEGMQAELSAVSALLQQAMEFADPVGELQYSHRKKSLEQEIGQIAETPEKSASVALFFGGAPVLGSRGISADFAGHALELFQELVSRSFAKAELGVLGKRGPVPYRDSTKLMITEIAKGSFGFVLDEMSDQLELEDTSLKLMVEDVAKLLERTASPNELDFEEIAETLDARTLQSLRDFFITLDSNNATIRVVEDIADFTLDSTSIHRGRVRTEATSIDESEDFITGVLFGFLPEHRKFELKIATGETVYGSVSKEAAEQYISLLSSEKVMIGNSWKLKIKKRVVKPLNRPPRQVNKLIEFLGEEKL